MQAKRSTVVLLSAILCLFVTLVYPVCADETTESFMVYTEKQVYLEGEEVNIYVKANSIDPGETITVTDVIVCDSSNSSVVEWHGLSIILTDATQEEHVETFTVASEGNYTVYAEATGCLWKLRCCWFFCWRWPKYWPPCHVIPEYPLGTITAIAAIFGALALNTARKRRNLD